jgi:hypothetical protein
MVERGALLRERLRQREIELADPDRSEHILRQLEVRVAFDDEAEVEHDVFDALTHAVQAETSGVGEAVHVDVHLEVTLAAPEDGARADQEGSTVVPAEGRKTAGTTSDSIHTMRLKSVNSASPLTW